MARSIADAWCLRSGVIVVALMTTAPMQAAGEPASPTPRPADPLEQLLARSVQPSSPGGLAANQPDGTPPPHLQRDHDVSRMSVEEMVQRSTARAVQDLDLLAQALQAAQKPCDSCRDAIQPEGF